MSACFLVLAVAALSPTPGLALSPPEEPPMAWKLGLSLRFGIAGAPFPATALPEVRGHAGSAVLMGQLRLTPGYWLGVRAPLALASVAQPAGSYVDRVALGNPELFIQGARCCWTRGSWRARASARASVGVPLAGSSLPDRQALALANALEGSAEPGLYTTGVLPIALGGALELSSSRWLLGGDASFPLSFPTAAPQPGEGEPRRGVGFAPVVSLRAGLRVGSRFVLQVAGLAVFQVLPPERPSIRERRSLVRAGVLPGLRWQMGAHASATLELLVPVSPSSNERTVALGLRGELGW